MMPSRALPAALALAGALSAQSIVSPSWQVQFRDTTALFIGLSAVDGHVVWASGTGGRVARTTDGGASWAVMRVPGADSLQFRDVHAFSADEAWVLSIGNGDQSRIYRTTDGGATWQLSFRNADQEAFFDCFSFWDRRRGFAFSDSHAGEFTLIRTADGQDWVRIDPAVVPDARPGEGAFAASGTCVVTRPGGLGWFATGASGVDTRVVRTADYGASWRESVTPVLSRSGTEGLTSLAFLDDAIGVAFGATLAQPDSSFVNVIVTTDGGATWVVPGPPVLGGIVYGGSVVPGAATLTLVAAGPSGTAWSADGGRTWTTIDTTNTWVVTFLDADTGWAAGRGHISRFVNGRE